MRFAKVWASTERVRPYLPGNYEVVAEFPATAGERASVLIGGDDKAGWTLDGYVLPRLATALIFGEEVSS